MTKEALKLALDALNDMACWQEGREVDMGFDEPYAADTSRKAITAIKEALAQPEQDEPYGYFRYDIRLDAWVQSRDNNKGVAFYTTPPTWVGLTDEEILAVNISTVTKLIDEPIVCDTDHNIIQLCKAIEVKLKQKNTKGQE